MCRTSSSPPPWGQERQERKTRACLARLELELVRLGLIREQEDGRKLFPRTLSSEEMNRENLQHPSFKYERDVPKIQAYLLRARC